MSRLYSNLTPKERAPISYSINKYSSKFTTISQLKTKKCDDTDSDSDDSDDEDQD